MKPVGVLINPHSGINRRLSRKQLRELEHAFGDLGLVRFTNSRDEVSCVLREFVEMGIEVLCISGGDGTIRNVLTTYLNLFGEGRLPILAPLRGGTINMIAGNLGLGFDQVKVAGVIASLIKERKFIPTTLRGTLRIHDSSQSEPLYCFTWMDGFLYRFLELYYKRGGGYLALFGVMAEVVAKAVADPQNPIFRESHANIYIDGKKMEPDGYLFIAASSLGRLILGFKPFLAEPVPGESFGVICTRKSYLRRVFLLPFHLYRGAKSEPSGSVINLSARKLTVEGAKGYVVDGEIISFPQAEVEINPGPALRMLHLKGTS
ncbi:MAG: diacylglycerol kinase family protein [Candidatus Caldarchaeum sp.]